MQKLKKFLNNEIVFFIYIYNNYIIYMINSNCLAAIVFLDTMSIPIGQSTLSGSIDKNSTVFSGH